MDRLQLNSDKIDWYQGQDLFLNPRQSASFQKQCEQVAQEFISSNKPAPSFFLSSSGTTKSIEQVDLKVIPKKNFLNAAKAFNDFFQISSKDRWLKALPRFHVGGLAILARSHLVQGFVEEAPELQWEPQKFLQILKEKEITRLSLVPTQIFDLIRLQEKAPASLISVFIGGAALSSDLYLTARDLGWPLLPSYGMTETSSMVLSADSGSLSKKEWPQYKTLPGVKIKLDAEGRLSVQAPGLLSHHLQWSGALQVTNYPKGSFFETVDYFEQKEGSFQFKARHGDLIKISGELVNVEKLRQQWEMSVAEDLKTKTFLHFRPSERKGSEIVLYAEKVDGEKELTLLAGIKKYNEGVLPFERIQESVTMDSLPRTELGKVKVGALNAGKG